MTLQQRLDLIQTQIVTPFIYLMLALAAIYFVWGVFLFVRSVDNPDGQEKGKKHMMWGIIGLAIMLGAKGIIGMIIETVQ